MSSLCEHADSPLATSGGNDATDYYSDKAKECASPTHVRQYLPVVLRTVNLIFTFTVTQNKIHTTYLFYLLSSTFTQIIRTAYT